MTIIIKRKIHKTKVVNVRKYNLTKMGYKNIDEWLADPVNVYIGRNMSRFPALKSLSGSIWGNPYSVNKYGRDQAIDLYIKYIIEDKDKINQLVKLKGLNLGCWCKPAECHGDILKTIIELTDQMLILL